MEFVAQMINGLSTGGMYALVAIGYTMVYGIGKMINFAHGEIIMVGAYLAYVGSSMMGQTMIGMMSTGLGSTLGNVLGGFLQDNYSIQAMFIFACAMTLIGFLIIFFTLRKKVSLKKHKSYLSINARCNNTRN